jgi:hypothetical protein
MPDLTAHPHSPSRVARSVAAQASRSADGKLSLHYSLQGDVDRMNIPPPVPSRIGWKLWRHTCCEVFVRAEGAEVYHELNLSPSGEWTAYAFGRYRDGRTLDDDALDPQIAVERHPGRLDLYALVDLVRLAQAYRRARLAVGLAVIIDEGSGAFSYWALRHAPGKPDFHHIEAFALRLDEIRD